MEEMAVTAGQGSEHIVEIGSEEGPQTCLQQPTVEPLTEETRHVAISISEEGSRGNRCFPATLKKELQSDPPWPTNCCIYKVPVNLRSIKESAYTPKVVSIGPIHHGAKKLQPMKAHKRRYLNLLLNRNLDISLEDLVQVLSGWEERARNCYEDEVTRYLTSDQFVEIMLLDSCFVITLFLLISLSDSRDKDDPMFNGKLLRNTVKKDLMLLENQLPFFILEQLYHLVIPSAPPKEFLELTFSFFQNKMQSDQFRCLASPYSHQVKHFVDLTLKCNLPSHRYQNPIIKDRNSVELPTATELRKSGIKFKKVVHSCFIDIKFTNAVLEIPTVSVYHSTEQKFRNLIAMELCHGPSTFHITDYTMLMNSLIKTPDDVSLLRSCGIINNRLGSDDDACQIFNNITKGAFRNRQYSRYNGIVKDVNVYYNRRWNLWKAHLKRDYFNNPWTIISLNAALILLICSLTQAVCSVISLKW